MFRRDTAHTLSSFIEKDAKIDETDEDAANNKDDDDDNEPFQEEEEDYKRPHLDPQTQGCIFYNFFLFTVFFGRNF